MKIPLPFLHWWTYMRSDNGPTPWRCRECRICGRFEIMAYGYWNKTSRSDWIA